MPVCKSSTGRTTHSADIKAEIQRLGREASRLVRALLRDRRRWGAGCGDISLQTLPDELADIEAADHLLRDDAPRVRLEIQRHRPPFEIGLPCAESAAVRSSPQVDE